ncbi:mitochondrial acidic protein Mam33p [Diutina catenulata]
MFSQMIRMSSAVARRSAIQLVRPAQRSFVATPARFNAAANLKEVLKSELKISSAIPNELEPAYSEFIESNGYQVIATEGTSNVQLVKEKGDETIRIFFDIDEVTDIPMGQTAEGEQAFEDDFDAQADSLDSLLCNIKVLVEKPSQNDGLFINLFLQNTENSFMIDFVNYQNDVQSFLKDQILAKNEFIDKVKYQGPRFSDLDESLQVEFENYLAAKGLDDELADFIVAFSEFKEENEYRTWLSNLAKFV